jgi:hypothetical protein
MAADAFERGEHPGYSHGCRAVLGGIAGRRVEECDVGRVRATPDWVTAPLTWRSGLPDALHRTVIVAMVVVRVVQVAGHQVVDVVPMRHRLVPGAGTVRMPPSCSAQSRSGVQPAGFVALTASAWRCTSPS